MFFFHYTYNAAVPTGTDYQTIALYFFSALAQVWAALAVFGVLAIRDRFLQLEQSLENSGLLIISQLKRISRLLVGFRRVVPEFDEIALLEKHAAVRFIKSVSAEDYISRLRQDSWLEGSARDSEGGFINYDSIRSVFKNANVYLPGFEKYQADQQWVRSMRSFFLLAGLLLTFLSVLAVTLVRLPEGYLVAIAASLLVFSFFPIHALLMVFDAHIFPEGIENFCGNLYAGVARWLALSRGAAKKATTQ